MARRSVLLRDRTEDASGESPYFANEAEQKRRLQEEVMYWHNAADEDSAELHRSAMGGKYLFAIVLWFCANFLVVLACFLF